MARLLYPLVLLTFFVGCGDRVPIAPAPTRNPKIPVEVSYPVIEEWDDDTRRSVSIRLNMKVPAEVLREIALEVKSREKRQYLRTFVWYYLPPYDTAVRKEAWAKSDFDPTLKVEFLGSDIETEKKGRAIPVDETAKLFGPWFIDDMLGCRKLLIIKDDGGPKLARFYTQPGESSPSKLKELPSELGHRFQITGGSDVYEVNERGDLRIYNDEGKLLTASPIIQ